MGSFLFDYLLGSPLQVAILSCGIALIFILLFMREPATLTLASDDKGRLQISRHALNRLVEACCEQLNGVASARAAVTRSRGKLNTEIRLKVRPEAKLDAIRGYLTQEVTDIFQQNLGLKSVGIIDIKVVGASPRTTF